jgi:hypothetical protein
MNYETYEVRVYTDGDKFWYQNGQQHRLDGPAVERTDGSKIYYLHGQRHRLDGPACEYANGEKYWYIKGIKYSKEEFDNKIKELTKPSCEGKFVEVDGVKYQLVRV